MSNPKQSSNKAEFVALLTRLLENHRQTYNDVSNATGIGEQILKNAYNGRNFGAKTSRINALKAYLAELETSASVAHFETKDQKLARMEAEIKRLEKKVAAVVAALEKLQNEKNHHAENGA